MIQGKLRLIVPIVLLLAATTAGLRGQSKPAGAEWTTYGGDLASTRYSPLDQITKDNFNKLEIAWRFKTDSMGPRPEFNFQVTPLMVDGVVYTTAGTRRAVVALDAATGEMMWMHSENEGKRGESAPRLLSGRGLAYWPGSGGQGARIVYVTPGYQMVALDAKTGVPAAGFGKNGIVDLKMDDDQPVDPITGEIGLHATPIIAKDVIVVGAAHLEGSAPKSKNHEKGFIRGYDARTGKRLWIFHTIPSPGEFGNNTWEKDSWAYTGNAGVWAQMTIDEELGMVYLPVELPTGDYYGGNRPGNGLFGESVVALDLKTGVRKWHYQLVHHGIWDMDIPCAPILADITVDGSKIKAIAQITKQGWVYVFDRTNGQPVWPIEERPVEKGDVPGEWYSPTQPFVTKPPPFDRQGVSPDDVIDFTPELHAEALEAAVALQDRTDLHAAGRQQSRRAARHADPAVGHRRRELAGRRARSGNEQAVHLLGDGAVGARSRAAGSGEVRFRLRARRRARERAAGADANARAPGRRATTRTGRLRPGAGQRSADAARGQARPAGGRGQAPAGARGRRRRRAVRARPAAHQAALRAHHGDRSEQRRHQLADRARRHARQRQEPSGAEGDRRSRAPDGRDASACW